MFKKFKLERGGFGLDYSKKLIMCRKCYTFYYKNSWHFGIPKHLKKYRSEKVPVLITKCLTCRLEDDAFYDNAAELIFGCKTALA